MIRTRAIAIASLLLLWGGVAPQTLAQTSPANRDILFRTKRYVVQIYWRSDRPYMTVSHNGGRVIANAPAQVAPRRGSGDLWITYTYQSGDYLANVRVDASGRGMIEVMLDGKVIAEEYATNPPAKQQSGQITGQINQKPSDSIVLAFQTDDYVVKVYRQPNGLYLNLYNRKSAATELNRVAVKQMNTSKGTIYRYEGDSTVRISEDGSGQRSLIILRDNQFQYRGVGY
ncbi:MAG: hypothetical protein HC866_02265 [Leptolyngbyaceae cyanobacterium RU_5_1]|nr:hypothetical protein [Leptolyngbyaceae cyanobacterium RU_5_1]